MKVRRTVVVGCSQGGLEALQRLLAPLPDDYPLPIVVVAHLPSGCGGTYAEMLGRTLRLPVRVAQDKLPVLPGIVHLAPGGYHLLVEEDASFALSVDAKVCHVRPSVDVLFESAAALWGDKLLAVVLTGANSDGAAGMLAVKAAGGRCLVEDPDLAEIGTMPRAAIETGAVDEILPVDALSARLLAFAAQETASC